MARTAVTPVSLVVDASVLVGAALALDPANGHSIPFDPVTGRTFIDIDSTFAGVKNFTLRAGPGTGPNGWPQGGALGDLIVPLNAQRALIPISRFRFGQLDGNFWVDVPAGATGFIRAYYFPVAS